MNAWPTNNLFPKLFLYANGQMRNLILTLFKNHMGIHWNSFKAAFTLSMMFKKPLSKIAENETISNVSFSADENCHIIVRNYI